MGLFGLKNNKKF